MSLRILAITQLLSLSPLCLAQENGTLIAPDFQPSENREWLRKPELVSITKDSAGQPPSQALSYFMHEGKFYVAILYADSPAIHQKRPVVYDATGTSVPLGLGSMSGGDIAMAAGKTETLKEPPFVGIEEIDPATWEHLRRKQAGRAADALRVAGITPLPFPESGEPYPFKLTALDGSVLSSETLKGKVVLIDFWAASCAPCMMLLSPLKSCYQKYHEQGLVIIGINHDSTKEKAMAAVKKTNLPWPTVLAPMSSDGTEQLTQWLRTIGGGGLPKLFLINRDGILISADLTENDLEAELEKLLPANVAH